MQGIVMQIQVTVETDDLGGYRCYFADLYDRAGWGDTPAKAVVQAVEYVREMIDWEHNHENIPQS